MFHKTKALNSDHEKSSEFNSYFASVFNEKEDHQFPETFDNPSIKLDDFQLSVSDVEDLLRKCPDSSACGADNIPSFVLSSCSDGYQSLGLIPFGLIFSSSHLA